MKKILRTVLIIILAPIFLAISLGGSCTGRCKDSKSYYCPMFETDIKYFGNYRPGFSWVYTNQDGTKTDSMYVDSFSDGRWAAIEPDCIGWKSIEMKIKTNYLPKSSYDDYIDCSYENTYCKESGFRFDGSTFILRNKDADVYESAVLIDSLTLPNGKTYHQVIHLKHFWIAPEVGLIQFIAPDEHNRLDIKDTFYLHKLYTP